jgi:hypothetical protein
MSDEQKAVDTVKRYELKCEYDCMLTQDLEAVDNYVRDGYQ